MIMKKTRLIQLPSFLLLSLLFCSCATTDDPHKGGLIGYLATGEEGYQKRLDQREQDLADTESQTEGETRKTSALETRREEMRLQLQAQREELAQLEAQTQQMLADTRAMKDLVDAKEQEKEQLLSSLAVLQEQIEGVKGDSTLLVAEKQERIDALKAEVNQLLEMFALLNSM